MAAWPSGSCLRVQENARVFLAIMLMFFDLSQGELVHILKRNFKSDGPAGLRGRRPHTSHRRVGNPSAGHPVATTRHHWQ